jgi:mannosyltransferase OCH1-like enzyme
MMPNYDPNILHWTKFNPEVQKTKMIPKIIHQMWLGNDPPKVLMDTWRKENPDWAYILWTEENLKEWTFKNQDLIEQMPELNGKCDIMRYEILYHFGGFFIDADTYCLKPLSDHLFKYDCTSVFESEKYRGGLIACGFMSAHPGCELMRLCIDNIKVVKSPAWWYVGPSYFTYIVQKYKYPIKIHPSHYFIPKHYAGTCYKGNGNVYCDHLWGNTFKNYDLYKSASRTLKPKIRHNPLKLELNHIYCRRTGIGQIILQHLKDRKPYQHRPSRDQQYSLKQNVVSLANKFPAS